MTMKSNIEALAAALRQVDDSQYVSGSVPIDEVVIDGRWQGEPLEGALIAHLVPLSSIITTHKHDAMFLRETWATGDTGDGREFEISASGPTLILQIGPFDETREVYSIRLQDLAPAWLRAVGVES